MTDTGDLNLVLGRILPGGALHGRTKRHVKRNESLLVPFSVGLELLFVAARFDFTCGEALGVAEAHFEIESTRMLYTAAEALDAKEIPTVFGAVHLADALHRGGRLHTADNKLLASSYPTTEF